MPTLDTPETPTAADRYDHAIERLRDALTPDQFRLVLELDEAVGDRLRDEHALAGHAAAIRDVRASLDRHGLL